MIGQTVAHYRILEKLGQGGMGVVYKAEDTKLRRVIALKFLPPHATENRERLIREAQAAAALNHPNIATVYEAGVDNGITYIAMELIEGDRLRDLMSAPLPAARVLDLGFQMIAGLAKAHEGGVVHRDLKPENIMLSRDGFVKILDFGLAKFRPTLNADDSTLSATQDGVVMGTLPYMSPEQACGREIDGRSDQFSLGTILYEMVTGRHPFRRASAAETLAAVVDRAPDPLPSSVPAPLAAVIRRCLEKDPARRYESTRQLSEEVKNRPQENARSRRWLPFVAVAALCAAAAGVAIAVKWPLKEGAGRQETQRFVAVLPFRGIAADPSQAYLVDGITQEIRDQLSRTPTLRLLSANASSRYKDVDAKRLASETGVGSVVEGAVRIEQGRVRVSASLIDPRTDETLWSDQFERTATAPFAVQREVARRIAGALGTQITGQKRERPTDNLEAYDLYLRARNMNRTAEGVAAAMKLFRQAIQLDPEFAEAMAELSAHNSDQVVAGGLGGTDEAIRLARQALSLDPQSPLAHFALAQNYAMFGRVASARTEYEKSLELDPNCTRCMNDLADLNFYAGQFDSALRWSRHALLLAPNIANGYYHVAGALYYFGDRAFTEGFLSLYHARKPGKSSSRRRVFENAGGHQ